jgi:phenylacetate-CoA ligase
VLGRTTDFVLRSDGTIMHALAVIYVLRAVHGVGEFKIVQHGVQDIEVQIVPNGRWEEGGCATIESGLQQRLGKDVRIAIHLVEAIPPEASGKHRYVISHVPLSDGLKMASQGPTN